MKKINDLVTEFPQCFHPQFEPDRCGDGWYELIREFVLNLSAYNRYRRQNAKIEWQANTDRLLAAIPGTQVNPFQEIGWIQISCLKEKFGSLRIYTEGDDKYVQGLCAMAEGASYSICEECGTNQHLVVCRNEIIKY